MPASVWIRCLQLVPYLETAGIRSEINGTGRDTKLAVFVRRQDAESRWLAESLKARGIKIVFDLNVNYFDETGLMGAGYGTTAERVQECLAMVSVADAVCCSSQFIAARARSYHPNVVCLPDSFDTSHFRYRKPSADFDGKSIRAIWSGVSSKAGELDPVIPLLQARGISLTVISDAPPKLNCPFQHVPWSYHTFPVRLLDGELCLGPRRVDNPYDQGHSFFKIGIFMSAGVPALASPVPSYLELVGRPDCGRVCRSLVDWESALDETIADRDLLRQWSEKSIEAARPYRTGTVAEQYLDLLRNL